GRHLGHAATPVARPHRHGPPPVRPGHRAPRHHRRGGHHGGRRRGLVGRGAGQGAVPGGAGRAGRPGRCPRPGGDRRRAHLVDLRPGRDVDVNPQLAWYVARSTGIVAWAVLTASVVWGLLLSTRLARGRPTPAWLTDLH